MDYRTKMREYRKRYYETHKEKIKEYQKKYWKEHGEEINAKRQNRKSYKVRCKRALDLLKTLDEDTLSNMQLSLEIIGHIEYILKGGDKE